MYNNAVEEFQKTEESKLLQEKLDQMEADFENMFNSCGRQFAEECFVLIDDKYGQQGLYVYYKCLLDCVKLLKWLGVLA